MKLGARVNMSNAALTQVAGWDFNSVAKIGDKVVAVGPTGICVLGGDLDGTTKITAWVKTPYHTITIPHVKRIRKLYLDFTSSGKLEVLCSNDDVSGYTLAADTVMYGNRKFTGRKWSFKVSNVDGADFSVDKLSVLFHVLTRSREE